ncbi:hypothetical protein ACQPXS_02260 [Streptomyces sp. CA-142005]|uniref:hypothetical protein n=1 Tax=Streptomyces sp. CA-142005 TaxID=3240052 RepID=UPI003D9349A9
MRSCSARSSPGSCSWLLNDTAKLKHFEAIIIDQQEGLLAGVSDAAPSITGQPLVTVEKFINENRSAFGLGPARSAS